MDRQCLLSEEAEPSPHSTVTDPLERKIPSAESVDSSPQYLDVPRSQDRLAPWAYSDVFPAMRLFEGFAILLIQPFVFFGASAKPLLQVSHAGMYLLGDYRPDGMPASRDVSKR